MERNKTARCELRLQRRIIDAELMVNNAPIVIKNARIALSEEPVPGGRLLRLRLSLDNEPCEQSFNLQSEWPVRLLLPMEKPKEMTVFHLFKDWWTRPSFVSRFEGIPPRTQMLLLRYPDRCACLVPMVGKEFKACLMGGTQQKLTVWMSAYRGGQSTLDEPVYLLTEGPTASEAVHSAFTWLAEYYGIPTREERRIPELFRYLGWCSWDCFYTQVTEEGLRLKAAELTKKQVPVRWMIIDDGWLSTEGKKLVDFAPDRTKFPQGFRPMVDELKRDTCIRWFGVWHALCGYWGGIAPESRVAIQEREHLYSSVSGKLLPSPFTGVGFYRHWYQQLRREGIDFVKVDAQSVVPYQFENSLPLAEAARGLHQALEGGAAVLDGAVINCMGMAMENVLSRGSTAVSRNSDDFFPRQEGSFTEHLLQNAYNALYHDQLYCCDWDMFWTQHPDAVKHSLLRAISGGPVYFSDRVGDTNPEILKPLAYLDGELLRMDHSAKPTEDCIFTDPTQQGVLKLHNTAPWGGISAAGGIAAYNLTGECQRFSIGPKDIPGLAESSNYWVYDYFERRSFLLGREETLHLTLEKGGFCWYVFLPTGKSATYLGLLEKYVGFTAVETICEGTDRDSIVLHESGPVGWLSDCIPSRVWWGGEDVTSLVQVQKPLFTLLLPEKPGRGVLTLEW